MSGFAYAHAFEVNDDTPMAASTANNYQIGPTGIDILREASAPEAAHDSSARAYPPRCFPGTRKQYIQDIIHWAIPALCDTHSPIYWMKGPPGVGKSAIAQTCAEELQERGALGAAFFFSTDRRDKPEEFFPSIAYQLSTIHPAYRDIIDRRVHHDNTVINKAMRFQFRYLIAEPLRQLEKNGKGIGKRVPIFVDGLDECEDIDAQCEIIRIIAAEVPNGVLPLCWAFFSRPEPHIEAMFSRTAVAPHCSQVVLPITKDANGEIELYLSNGFENICRHRNTTSVHPRWPSAEDMKIVVSAANGSFIYATTVLRFVGHLDPLGPQKRLGAVVEVILDYRKRNLHTGASTDAPFAELDAFYTLILQRIPAQILPVVHLLLALLCRGGSRSAILAANTLGLSKDQFETICTHASAAIHFQVPGYDFRLDSTINTTCTDTRISQEVLIQVDRQVMRYLGGLVSFYHKSFRDFLLDPARSGSYHVNHSEALAKHYLKMHLNYDQHYCWYGPELVPAPGLHDQASSLSYPDTNELVNLLIKARIYNQVGNEDSVHFSRPEELEKLRADVDFRKHLHISILYWRAVGSDLYSFRIWSCRCSIKFHPGICVLWISHNEFPKFNAAEFKSIIAQRLRAGIIQPYHYSFTSRIRFLFRNKPLKGIESALYCMGHSEKSIYWCWQINYKLQQYREFRTINLAMAEKIFQEECFDWESDSESDSESDGDVPPVFA